MQSLQGTRHGDNRGTIERILRRPDASSGTPRAHAIDRWIFVGMAAWFILIVLVGFIPDAIGRLRW